MKKYALLVSIMAVGASGAQAADLAPRPYTKAPVMVAEESWAGIYLGGQVGYDFMTGSYAVTNAGVNEPVFPSPRGAAGGGHLGAQGQWGKWVLGVEGTYDWADMKETDSSSITAGRLYSFSTDGIATVVGKVGYSFDRWMIYAKGGWATADINTSITAPTAGVKQWQSGYTVGTGLDYKITHNWIIGSEFNFYQFKFDRNGVGSDGSAVSWYSSNAPIYSLSFHLSYLFNMGGPVVAKY